MEAIGIMMIVSGAIMGIIVILAIVESMIRHAAMRRAMEPAFISATVEMMGDDLYAPAPDGSMDGGDLYAPAPDGSMDGGDLYAPAPDGGNLSTEEREAWCSIVDQLTS